MGLRHQGSRPGGCSRPRSPAHLRQPGDLERRAAEGSWRATWPFGDRDHQPLCAPVRRRLAGRCCQGRCQGRGWQVSKRRKRRFAEEKPISDAEIEDYILSFAYPEHIEAVASLSREEKEELIRTARNVDMFHAARASLKLIEWELREYNTFDHLIDLLYAVAHDLYPAH